MTRDPAARRSYILTAIIVAANLGGVATIQVMRQHTVNEAKVQRSEITRAISASCGAK